MEWRLLILSAIFDGGGQFFQLCADFGVRFLEGLNFIACVEDGCVVAASEVAAYFFEAELCE